MKMRMTNDKYGFPHTYVEETVDEIGAEFSADMLAAGFEVHVYTNTRDGVEVLVDDADEIALEQVVEDDEETRTIKEELDKEKISYEICESRIHDLAGRLDADGLDEHEVMMEERERVGKRISSMEDALKG